MFDRPKVASFFVPRFEPGVSALKGCVQKMLRHVTTVDSGSHRFPSVNETRLHPESASLKPGDTVGVAWCFTIQAAEQIDIVGIQ